ncbi:MAG TPA: hypothetical protein VKB41_05100 [Steroidobacteraceae bacterium]|nr:hypothetical protein [Steroidobacteraceae bacterium]
MHWVLTAVEIALFGAGLFAMLAGVLAFSEIRGNDPAARGRREAATREASKWLAAGVFLLLTWGVLLWASA